MLRTISVIAVLALIASTLSAQNGDSLLLQLEWKWFHASTIAEKDSLHWEKLQLILMEKPDDPATLQSMREYNVENIRDSIVLRKFRWNKSLIAFSQHEYLLAWSEINKYKNINGVLRTEEEWLLYAMIASKYSAEALDSAVVQTALFFPERKEVDCLCEVVNFKIEEKPVYKVMSAVIPGSGSIAQGKVGKGLGSLILNGAAIYGLYELSVAKLYLNAGLWAVTWFPKIYLGNIELTKKITEKRQLKKRNELSNNCELVLKNYLNKYPLKILF